MIIISNIKYQILNIQRNGFRIPTSQSFGGRGKSRMTDGRGFTLLELLIVFSVLAILSSVGIASFVNYSRSQVLNIAASDFVTMLNKAKSRALSQMKIEQGVCVSSALDGYKVSVESGSYKLVEVCDENDYDVPNESKTLPDGITISSPSPSFLFEILTGNVENADSEGTDITVSGYDMTKTVTIYSNGRIAY